MAIIEPIDYRSNGTAVAGKAYFETSTKMFIVYNGTSWIELHSDTPSAPTNTLIEGEQDVIDLAPTFGLMLLLQI